MQRRVNALLDEFRETNHFITDTLRSFAWDRNVSHRIGYLGAEAFVGLLRTTGLDTKMTTAAEIDSNPDWFWDLVDAAHDVKDPLARTRALTAVAGFYYHLRRLGLIGEAFRKDVRSPYQFLGTREFLSLLEHDYEHRSDVVVLTYAFGRHARILVVPCRNPVVREMILDAFRRWPNVWDRRGSALRWPLEAEGWFEGTTDSVRSYLDMNTVMLSTAKEHILKKFPDNYELRKDALRFLFHIFSILIEDHPKHRFFASSFVWSNTLVCDKRVPVHIAKGYDIALYGQAGAFTGKASGVLLIHRNADLRSASCASTQVYTIDLSRLTIEAYWKAMADYALHNEPSRIHIPRTFLVWLQERKRNDAVKTHITQADLNAYRAEITRTHQHGAARNQIVNELNKFIDTATARGFLTRDADAGRLFLYFQNTYTPESHPLTPDQILRLRETIRDMALNVHPRYELLGILVDILLIDKYRPGMLCKLTISGMTRLPDGRIRATIKQKNRGTDKVTFTLTKHVTDCIDRALESTADIREACPVELEDLVFIYANPSCASLRFNVYGIERFNVDLQTAGKTAGLGRINSGTLRETYMSNVIQYSAQRGLNDLQKGALTGHAIPHTVKCYSIPDIRDILAFREPEDI